MDSVSPQRNLEPLLRDEDQAAPRMGAYAPPANSVVAPPPHPQPASIPAPVAAVPMHRAEPYDLHLTATNQEGEILNPPMMNNGDPPLPPLVSYCSYVKFALLFSKWIIFWGIVNTIAMAICIRSGYFDWDALWPFDSWKGFMLSGTWFLTAASLFIGAKFIERDVGHIDHISQYEQGRMSEDGEATNTPSAGSSRFILNFEHVYGQTSRMLDAFFYKKASTINSPAIASPETQPEGASSLVNISYVFWAVGLAAAIFLGSGTLLAKGYAKKCDPSNLPNANSTSTNGKDFQDVGEFPADVQEWILDQRDPWGGARIIGFDDDYYNGGDDNLPDATSFPVEYERDTGAFAAMTDGTIFFSALPPPTKTNDGAGFVSSSNMVLVQSGGSSGSFVYHNDIRNPRMFIPVESTIGVNSDGNRVATQYCFTASKEKTKKKKERRSWDAIIRTTDLHCVFKKTSSGETEYEFKKTQIVWSDKTRKGPDLVAASSGSSILIAHVGEDDFHVYQEVVSINPNSMTKKVVFHQTRSEGDFYGFEGGDHPYTRCVQDSVMTLGAIAGICSLVASGAWLILREGVPAGVAPIMLAIVAALRAITGPWGSGSVSLVMTIGTVLLHFILCCGGGGIVQLPAWIGRDMYIWALYSWLTSFCTVYTLFGYGASTVLSLVYLGISGLILDHPAALVMGCCSIAWGLVSMLFIPFYGYGDQIIDSALYIVIGFGIIGAASFISSNRNFCAAFCMPITRAIRVMFYGNAGGNTGTPQPMTQPVV